GGPTTWRADILTANSADSYREFLLEFSDFQLAYTAEGKPVNPPVKDEVGLPYIVQPANICPGGAPLPCPEAVSAADVGTMSVNYRNEPIPLRVRNPTTNTQAAGDAGDLSHVYRSNVTRADTRFNSQPTFYAPLTGGLEGGDPFTPLLRAYEDDKVQIRILVGAHEEAHNFGVHGIKWKFEPSDPNSGYRNNQMMGISEHYEFIVPKLPKNFQGNTADYLYQPGVAADDQWNGLWGLMRAYRATQADLYKLPNNMTGGAAHVNAADFDGVCPKTVTPRLINVTATTAKLALPGATLVYNSRTNNGGKLHDPTAIIFFRTEDLDPATGKLKAGLPVEPLILRASAGECLNISLTNKLPATATQADLNGFNTMPMIVENFNANQVKPSSTIGLHAQGVFFDVTRDNGVNVGFNPLSTVKPGLSKTFQWYAGDVTTSASNTLVATPIEFGSTGLTSSDPIKHSNKGAVGALIVEPAGATWTEGTTSRAQATISTSAGSFREFVMIFQNDINMRFDGFNATTSTVNGVAVPNTAQAEDSEDSGQKAINYRTEPLWKRMGYAPDTHLSCGGLDENGTIITDCTRNRDFTDVLSNVQVGGDPLTPVFTATVGQQVRMRLVHPAGHARSNVFMVHGHIWEEEPYVNSSTQLGSNPLSEWKGSQFGIGPGSHFDFLLKNGAGGAFAVPGDYLYRTFASFQFDGGMWGIFRVNPQVTYEPPPPTCGTCPPGQYCTDVICPAAY
ncbi:MAG: copper oxidase, partial [Acidobacteria bacterium]|nr:copper oxidase [Acidobacteriota bacterium]